MSRDDVVSLLRLRYQQTDQRFSDDTVDAWLEVLEPADMADVRAVLLTMVRGGARKVSLGEVCERVFSKRGKTPAPMSPEDLFVYASRRINYLNSVEAVRSEPAPDDDVVTADRARWWVARIRAEADERERIREADQRVRERAYDVDERARARDAS